MFKIILFTLLITFTYNVEASKSFVNIENLNSVYTTKSKCEKAESVKQGKQVTCYDNNGKNMAYHELKVVESDDLENPIMKASYKVVACSNMLDCSEKINALNLPKLNVGTSDEKLDYASYCNDTIGDYINIRENKLMPGWSYYCTGIVGYPKKEVKTLIENATKKQEYESKKAAEVAKAKALAEVSKAMAFGESIKKEVYLINASKGLSGDQIVQFMSEFAVTEKLLTVGAITTAKSNIEAIQVGPLMSATDKQYILDKINAYLGN